MDLETQIKEAVARGYCHPKNCEKIVDPDLLKAIVAEIMKSIQPMRPNYCMCSHNTASVDGWGICQNCSLLRR